jgi:hypothetical protein
LRLSEFSLTVILIETVSILIEAVRVLIETVRVCAEAVKDHTERLSGLHRDLTFTHSY